MCNSILTQVQEDELVYHIVKTTHESLLELVSFRRRVARENIESNILGSSSKDTLDVPSESVCPSCGVHLGDIIQKDSIDRLKGDDGTLHLK